MKPRLLQDDLIKRLGGPDKVAELTGRKKRMVYNEKTESYHYKARFDKVPMDQVRSQACSHACRCCSCKQGLERICSSHSVGALARAPPRDMLHLHLWRHKSV